MAIKSYKPITNGLRGMTTLINDEITKTMEELNKRISSVDNNTKDALEKFETKITEIDNKSKLDIILWMKNNWFGIVGILGIIYTVIKNMI